MVKVTQKVFDGNRVTIPKKFAEEMGVKEGDLVQLEMKEGSRRLTIVPVNVVPKVGS